MNHSLGRDNVFSLYSQKKNLFCRLDAKDNKNARDHLKLYTLCVCRRLQQSCSILQYNLQPRKGRRGPADDWHREKKKKRRHIYNPLCGKVGLQYLYVTGGSVFSSCSRRRWLITFSFSKTWLCHECIIGECTWHLLAIISINRENVFERGSAFNEERY